MAKSKTRHGYNIDGFSDYDASAINYYANVARHFEAQVTELVKKDDADVDAVYAIEFFRWRLLAANLLANGMPYERLKSNLCLLNEQMLATETT